MKMLKIINSAPLLLLIAIAMTSTLSLSQNSPQDYLNVHNVARNFVGVANITWDAKLEAYALNYSNSHKNDCVLVHSGGPYGENLANSTGDLSGRAAVNLWVAERPQYNYTSNSCVGGGTGCRHYTQVVWRNSVRLGCARVGCNNGGTFVCCSYDPRGNYVSQRPY